MKRASLTRWWVYALAVGILVAGVLTAETPCLESTESTVSRVCGEDTTMLLGPKCGTCDLGGDCCSGLCKSPCDDEDWGGRQL